MTQRSTLTADYQRDWPEYFACVDGKPPRDTLVRALDAFERERTSPAAFAIDIACGEGRDTRAILARTTPRWSVLATDYHADAIRLSMAKADLDALDRLAVAQLTMEELPQRAALARAGQVSNLPAVDLINASFALPFCKPEAFGELWSWITRSLRPGGRFAGQLFGDQDEWAPVRPQSHFTRGQVDAMLRPFNVEYLDETIKEGDDATGKIKLFHIYHIVAQKR
jgi:tellurite methyltransferase